APTGGLQAPAGGVMVLRVRLEVVGQVVDALAENSDLDLRGPRVGLVCFVTANEFGLAIFGQRHAASLHERPRTPNLVRKPGHAVWPRKLLLEQAQHVTSEQRPDAKRPAFATIRR